MIIIKHTNFVISEDMIPKEHFGVHSNSNEFIYFESIEERENYFKELYPIIEEL